jgi:hypothetical protein
MAMNLDFVRSGTRLVAMGYSSNEARVFRTFHDQRLGFDCDFTPGLAGADQRCVPSATVELIFTDAACTEPATWLVRTNGLELGEAVSSATEPGAQVCPGDAPLRRDAYRVGEQLSEEVIAGTPFDLFALRDGRCQTASLPAKVTPPVYRLTPLADDELVHGERVSLNVGDGLRVTRLIADDGAELNVGVTAADRTPCELQRDSECVPEPIARGATAQNGKFWAALNADCTEPAFQLPYPVACGAAKLGVRDDGVAAPVISRLKSACTAFSWSVLLPATDPPAYGCAPLPDAGAQGLAAPGEDVTGTLPPASRLRRGAGPLHVDWYAAGQNVLLPVLADPRQASPGVVPVPQFVTDAGKPCTIMPADDGNEHCVVLDEAGELASFPRVSWGAL